ncbi:bifunctional methionine sulfoxide reductase B/A protein [Flammeovirga sp. SubArs3]|uniref:bifunctional methionine sulfoxide reductase B/A protein n=1 Tax=Flammeovirga sp. SubArs3 TaxID=2995316 RepID=UPI00248D0867|nr:bifunctional methionine sulfoxide reductase B/A protein [Flammeovirga sp. SubArs3]
MKTLIKLLILLLISSVSILAQDMKDKSTWNSLNDFEKYVIVNKGTERPGTGIYDEHFEDGVYTCKRCNAPLYKSDDKFDAHCGWPAFDDEIEGAIKRETDKDGRRTEILCANCDAHLGHVFEGERLTDKNVRHCVNSVSLNFTPTAEADKKEENVAIFAGGCFWGVEYFFAELPGVTSTSVGYTGGKKNNPSYKEVCYTDTGHAEALKVTYDPNKVSYEELARLFFEIHDPTQVNRQGPDVGTQYRSEVFYMNQYQKDIAEKLINELKEKGFKVATKVTMADTFWDAEEYHQMYYFKHQKKPYCHIKIDRF